MNLKFLAFIPLLLILGLLVGYKFAGPESPESGGDEGASGEMEVLNAGVSAIVKEEPRQGEVQNSRSWRRDVYEIQPLATFSIRARVLSLKYYTAGRETNLSPVDLALGWGPMSDVEYLQSFVISQSNRWCHWKASNTRLTKQEVNDNSANMHIIPANKEVERALGRVGTWDIVRISGYLVEARGSDGWTWTSSLSRTDSGAHACEIIWAEGLTIEPR